MNFRSLLFVGLSTMMYFGCIHQDNPQNNSQSFNTNRGQVTATKSNTAKQTISSNQATGIEEDTKDELTQKNPSESGQRADTRLTQNRPSDIEQNNLTHPDTKRDERTRPSVDTLQKDIKRIHSSSTPHTNKKPAKIPTPKQPTPDQKKKDTASVSTLIQVNNPVDIHQHTLWNELLKSYVSDAGEVNYTKLKMHEHTLDQYLKLISTNRPASSWTKHQKMAYWINAYNAFTIKLILKHWPIHSIKTINNGKPWDQQWIPIGEETYSLNQIENDKLRAEYKDPRIHFAVNCAAASCPPIYNRAWTAQHLNPQLEKRTKLFINDADYNELNGESVNISKIFEWYAGDFGQVISFINKYAVKPISTTAKINYLKYDWTLNGH